MRRFVRRIGDIGKVIAAALSASSNETITGTWTFSTAPTIANPAITGDAPATPTAGVLYRDGLVRGWVETSGGGAWTIDDDFNVSSITDNGTGDLTVNWAIDLPNANYVVIGMSITDPFTSDVGTILNARSNTTKLVGSVRISCVSTAAAGSDPTDGVCVLAVGG